MGGVAFSELPFGEISEVKLLCPKTAQTGVRTLHRKLLASARGCLGACHIERDTDIDIDVDIDTDIDIDVNGVTTHRTLQDPVATCSTWLTPATFHGGQHG